jgi:hypothetical protein
MNDLMQLKTALQESWCKETAYKNYWDPKNIAAGQCTVSALIVQDYLGGDIIRYKIKDEERFSHYANQVNGKIIDTTISQFVNGEELAGAPLRLTGFASVREYLLDSSDTKHRYEILKSKVDGALNGEIKNYQR